MDCAGRKVAIARAKRERARVEVLRGDVVRQVYDVGCWMKREEDAFDRGRVHAWRVLSQLSARHNPSGCG
jgi:hypothetical protein